MNDVAELYNGNPDHEWQRLIRDPYSELEFRTSLAFFQRNGPLSGKILDAGGGPGRYTIALARLGYTVSLIDISDGCIRLARQKIGEQLPSVAEQVSECSIGDIRDLSRYVVGNFDATVCLDAMSHLHDAADRMKAIAELTRVTKSNGTVLLSVRSFSAVTRKLAETEPDSIRNGILDQLITTGNTKVCGLDVHFFRTQEALDLCENAGLRLVETAGSEGFFAGDRALTANLAKRKDLFDSWTALNSSRHQDPFAVGASEHILFALSKKA